jgi:hypothetical protein
MAVLAFENAADHFVGAFLGQELAGLLAEHFLVVGKVEIHGFRPVWSGWLPATIETLSGSATPGFRDARTGLSSPVYGGSGAPTGPRDARPEDKLRASKGALSASLSLSTSPVNG